MRGEYTVVLALETSGQAALQERESTNTAQRVLLEKYELASAVPLYQNQKDNIISAEVIKVSNQNLTLPVLMELNHCRSFSYMNKVIQEALIQVRLASIYC